MNPADNPIYNNLVSKNIQNRYLEAFNAGFKENYLLRKSEDLDEEIKDNPPIDLGYEYPGTNAFIVEFSIIPFTLTKTEEDSSSGVYSFKDKKIIKYQLIKYKYLPGSYHCPPETVDMEFGNFTSFNQALQTAFKTILEEKLSNVLTSVYENEMESAIIQFESEN